jgi:DNA polymerase-3 subunit epsilon
LDAEILADVYLLLTGGQTALSLDANSDIAGGGLAVRRVSANRQSLPVVTASAQEEEAHREFMTVLAAKAGDTVWDREESLN